MVTDGCREFIFETLNLAFWEIEKSTYFFYSNLNPEASGLVKFRHPLGQLLMIKTCL